MAPDNSEIDACCPPTFEAARVKPGYRLCHYVQGWLETPAGEVPQVAGKLQIADIAGHWAMRWGFGRSRYSIAPGLYAIGEVVDITGWLGGYNLQWAWSSGYCAGLFV